VLALAVFGGELIAQGSFTAAGGSPASNIARWNGSTWLPVGGGTDLKVTALLDFNGLLIAGGWFNSAGGLAANHIARWDGVSWQAFGPGVGGVGPNDSVRALAEFNGELVAGGWHVPPTRWDGAQWQPLGTPSLGANITVNAMTANGWDLIASGNFTLGPIVTNIARWNGSSWQSIATGLIGGEVKALGTYGADLVAVGSFSDTGFVHIGAWHAGRDPIGCLSSRDSSWERPRSRSSTASS
jgi:trimeric autotransporter adhesin